MKQSLTLFLMTMCCLAHAQTSSIPTCASEDTGHVMSEGYWEVWNDAEQARIDKDIDTYRKADAVFRTGSVKRGTTVKVEQVKSDFVFGCSAFNWGQLGSEEMNEAYRNLFVNLFNRATVPFYWRDFEPDPGNLRYKERYIDTEKWWSHAGNPKFQPHWRRPCTDPMVEWLSEHDVAMHGHPLVWGSRKWHFPRWIQYDGVPENERRDLDTLQILYFTSEAKGTPKEMTAQEVADRFPVYMKLLEEKVFGRIDELMGHYDGKIGSWDVVNESATDFGLGVQDPSLPMCRSHYGYMPADYTFRSVKRAESVNNSGALLNVNDYIVDERFINQAADLVKRGAKVDVFGSQMHLFQPQQCLDIAAGKHLDPAKKLVEPSTIRPFFEKLGSFGVPTCLSEITITSAGEGERGEMIQAVIARNLYRIWFSLPSMMGITWWNAVDDCGAAGEPTISGVCHRDMTPKTVYFALDQLINHEWRTNVSLTPVKGKVAWRGFKGTYRISWTDTKGVNHSETFILE